MKNLKQIEQIIKLQKEINQLDKDSIYYVLDDDEYDTLQNEIMYDAIQNQVMQKESELENLVNNLTKKKMRVLIYKLLEEIK